MGMALDKTLIKNLLVMAIPIALQNLITYSVNLADTVMLGNLGEIQLSAASSANQLYFIMAVLGFGIGSGSNVLISQYWGKGNPQAAKQVMAIALRVAAVISLASFGAAVLLPHQVMRIFITDAMVIAEGVRYLKIVGYSLPFAMIAVVLIMMLRPVGAIKIALVSSGASLVVNIGLNWVLIFGKLGAPALGVQGAAIATLIARVVELAVVVVYVFFLEKQLALRLSDLLHTDTLMLRDFAATCSPVLVNELFWSLGTSATTAIIGQMGTGFMAANSIYASLHQMMMVIFFGLSNAGAVLVGNSIGAGQKEKVRPIAAILIVGALLCGTLLSGILYFGRGFVLSFYTLTPETYRLAMDIMAVGAGMFVFQGLSNVSMMGVLRGGGDARFVLIVDTVFLWLVCIPLGAFAGFYLQLAPPIIYLILRMDGLLKVSCAIPRIVRGRWVRDVTR